MSFNCAYAFSVQPDIYSVFQNLVPQNKAYGCLSEPQNIILYFLTGCISISNI